jgi:sugar lactone lactonase YvrE
VWDAARGRLLWVDIWAGLLHSTDPDDPDDAALDVDLGAPLSSVHLTTRDTRVVTAGLCVLELTADGTRHLADLPESPCLRANDAAVDPAGRLWVGTMTLPQRPAQPGSLWRLDPGKCTPERVLGDLLLANGMGWSPAGDLMYVVDSLRQRVDVYPYDAADGRLGARRELVVVPPEDGMPDGLAVDTDGCLWVALAGGGAVRRYAPGGAVLEQVDLPVAFPTSCAFGGDDMTDLFVTTGSRPVPPESRAGAVAGGAGALFLVSTEVRGQPATAMEA